MNNYFRLHVVANSDSINDQVLKLKVADKVSTYISSIIDNVNNKLECIEIITTNIQDILDISESVLKENNVSGNIVAYIGNIKYDKKTFNEEAMNAGIYPSLKIEIGDAKGANWWSLISSPFSNEINTSDILSNEEVKVESKILHWIESLFK